MHRRAILAAALLVGCSIDRSGLGPARFDTAGGISTDDAAASDLTIDDGAIDPGDASAVDETSELAPEAAIDAELDVLGGSDAVIEPDAGSVLSSTPNKTVCKGGALCSAYCCGRYNLFTFSWGWTCETDCFAGRDFRCDEKADCPAGQSCCGKLPIIGTTIEGSNCRPSCGADPQLCMTDAECGGGKTCTPQKFADAPHTAGVCK